MLAAPVDADFLDEFVRLAAKEGKTRAQLIREIVGDYMESHKLEEEN